MERSSKLAVALAEHAGAVELKLRGIRGVATATCMLGNPTMAGELALGALDAARTLGLRHLEPLLLRTQMFIMDVEGDLEGALHLSQQRVAIEREAGDPRGLANAIVNLGVSWLNFGEFEQAGRYLEEGWRLTQGIGDRAGEPYPLVSLSLLARWKGDLALATSNAQSALDIAVKVNDPNIEREALAALGDAELALGRFEAAKRAFERAHSLARPQDPVAYYGPTAGLARVALSQGDVEGALRAMLGILGHLASNGTLASVSEGQHAIRLTCFQALQRAGDFRATEAIMNAYTQLASQASKVSDTTLRRSFLNNIPEHREIVAAWSIHKQRQDCRD